MNQSSVNNLLALDFDKSEYVSRRQRIAQSIGSNNAALFQGAPRPTSAHPVFVQSKVFCYVSGILIERSYLLIEGDSAKSTLFVPKDNISNVAGGELSAEAKSEICSLMDIDEILVVEDLQNKLKSVKTLYLLQRPDEMAFATKFPLMSCANLRKDDIFENYQRRDQSLVKSIKDMYPKIEIGDLDEIVCRMRMIKSQAEIEIMRENGKMSARVCIESMKMTKPGVPVGVYNGIADFVFRSMGNCGHTYEYIFEPTHPESDVMVDGDLVLVDCAPNHKHYAMDIGRIWPVNGTFDPWQRHTYGLIVNYHKTLLNLAKPGRMVQDLYDEAAKIMLDKYKEDAKGTEIVNFMIQRGIRYYNHHVGMSAHDAIDKTWRDRPLEKGMVLAVDPMVRLPDALHPCHVRCEDTVVLTDGDCEVFTADAPFEIDDIEALMKQPGVFPENITL
jgi:Xaa-Pro aminopeptidase